MGKFTKILRGMVGASRKRSASTRATLNPPPPLPPEPTHRIVGTVHDSILLERLDVCNASPAPRYHWIEDGTYEDFKRNIIESDLPVPLLTFGFASSGFAMMGTMTGRLPGNAPPELVIDRAEIVYDPIPLMGTYTDARMYMPGDMVQYQNRHFVHTDFAQVEQSVLAMLLARPEMVKA